MKATEPLKKKKKSNKKQRILLQMQMHTTFLQPSSAHTKTDKKNHMPSLGIA
jgi:hypothetical protein